jgi:hypothetical protein
VKKKTLAAIAVLGLTLLFLITDTASVVNSSSYPPIEVTIVSPIENQTYTNPNLQLSFKYSNLSDYIHWTGNSPTSVVFGCIIDGKYYRLAESPIVNLPSTFTYNVPLNYVLDIDSEKVYNFFDGNHEGEHNVYVMLTVWGAVGGHDGFRGYSQTVNFTIRTIATASPTSTPTPSPTSSPTQQPTVEPANLSSLTAAPSGFQVDSLWVAAAVVLVVVVLAAILLSWKRLRKN